MARSARGLKRAVAGTHVNVRKISSEPAGIGPGAGAKSREEPVGSDDVLGERSPNDEAPADDIVDEASKESFPASDPPPWPLGGPPESDQGQAAIRMPAAPTKRSSRGAREKDPRGKG
jgi:hypothetical protein